ncbi:MAG: hypothetical protein DWQ06_09060 [Calditrichaeota bacterium]|nr:MAG: hypothetical protein DWQ06_09060 [Calditrichota bacterium]
MRKSFFLFLLIINSLVFQQVFADKIILHNGNELDVKILKKTEKNVSFEFANGTRKGKMSLPKSSIKKIVYTLATANDSLLQTYENKLSQVDKGSSESWYNFGIWCEKFSSSFSVESKNAFRKAIKLNPQHKKSRLKLGYRFENGKWQTEDEVYKSKGYINFEGSWYSPKELKETLTQRERENKMTEEEIQRLKSEIKALKVDSTNKVIYEEVKLPNLENHLKSP